MTTPKIRRVLPFLIAALLIAATAEAVTLRESFERTVPLRAGGEVQLSNVNGAVTVEAWDRNEVKIVAEKKVKADSDIARKVMEQTKILVTQEGGGVQIETKIPRKGDGFFDWLFGNQVSINVTYKLQVPRRAALDFVTVNGSLTVTGTRGKAQMETTNGAITLTDVQGDLDLGTTNGGIDVYRSAGALRASTTNGSIEAELEDLPDASDLRLTTTNGHVALRLPRDARLSIDAATTNGRIQSDFNVDGGQLGKRSLRGDINGGGGMLYIRTTNGGVEINEQ